MSTSRGSVPITTSSPEDEPSTVRRLLALAWGAASAAGGAVLGVWSAMVYVGSREVMIDPALVTMPLGYVVGTMFGPLSLAMLVEHHRRQLALMAAVGAAALPVMMIVVRFGT